MFVIANLDTQATIFCHKKAELALVHVRSQNLAPQLQTGAGQLEVKEAHGPRVVNSLFCVKFPKFAAATVTQREGVPLVGNLGRPNSQSSPTLPDIASFASNR